MPVFPMLPRLTIFVIEHEVFETKKRLSFVFVLFSFFRLSQYQF